jgi:hypothetical protein
MVRTLTFILGTVFLVQATAFAAGNPDTGPGCGLGKLAWADYKNQKDIAPQVLMATTNGTFGSNTFGISTGTSGCTNNGKVLSEHKATMFASLNFENLTQEMAQGEGEHLASLATLLNIPPEYQAEFFALTKERYNSLIESGETTSMAMLKALNETIAGHPVLAKVSANR